MTQSQGPDHARVPLTIQAVQPQMGQGGLVVVSPAVDADGRLDPIHSKAGDNLSPALNWNAVLEAESYALVVEDPDAPRDKPFVHWLVWDIPGTATGLPRGISPSQQIDGAKQGRNDAGEYGWYGMKPPPGHGVHRYHFQLFALSKRLGLHPDTPLAELLNALKGTTLASGELVGTFETPDPANSEPRGGEPAAGRGGLDRDDPDRHAPHDADGVVQHRGGGEDRPAR